jgi:urease accessory protein
MTTEARRLAFLTSLQLSDSFLPVGSYTFSYGLESFVRRGIVTDGNKLKSLLIDYLENQIGPCDMVAVSHAHKATKESDVDRIIEVDKRLFALKLIKETREGSVKSGRQFMNVMIRARDLTALKEFRKAIRKGSAWGNYATILGMVTALSGTTEKEACLILGYSFAITLLGASMRLARFGHFEIQAILEEVKPVILEVYEKNQMKSLDEMRSFCPYIDLMGMVHERASVRLFSS